MIELVCALLANVLPTVPVHDSEVIFRREARHNHSPGLVETPNGDLLACWFHGDWNEGSTSRVIRGARKERGEDHWSAPFIMADNPNVPDQNCVLFVDPRSTLWLFWISAVDESSRSYLLNYRTSTNYSGPGPPKWDWQDVIHCRPANLEQRVAESMQLVRQKFGDDIDKNKRLRTRLEDAATASQQKLSRRLGWISRTHPIMLSESRMMLPLYSYMLNCSLAAFTDDWGKTWEFSEPILPLAVQPTFVQRQNGDIVAMMRDKSPRRRIPLSVSKDGGQTWTWAKGMTIPNPDSSVECIALKRGYWLLVCNDTAGGLQGGRAQLTAYLSDDEGQTWNWSRRLERVSRRNSDDPPAIAYPSVIESRDGNIYCAYSWSQKPFETIKVARFNLAWLLAGESR